MANPQIKLSHGTLQEAATELGLSWSGAKFRFLNRDPKIIDVLMRIETKKQKVRAIADRKLEKLSQIQ